MLKRPVILSSFLALAIAVSSSGPAQAFPHIPKHMRKEVARIRNQATKQGAGGSIPCAAIMCLAPYVGMGSGGGPGCVAPKQIYFGIRVFDPWAGYDAILTSAVRGEFLNMCPDAMNKGTANAENAVVGEAYDAP
ncbi:hypothetical protein AD951_08380 [Acetobacter malorum]|uniref:Uncharacterized protein n=1 Tax=Acetobacter malorum TaxID=178901 RepID=A0A149UMR8_9PROT|nr:hypothetical protein AD951_08380 [Acetobacter malorum]